MSTTMPETISYGKVVGRFIQAVGDSVDPDFLPNAAAISGNVMFTPANPLSKELEAVPPATVVRSTITCNLNTQGFLRSPAGDVGVWLVAGIYKVSYSTQGAPIPPHDIVVTEAHTNENPLDLTLALPPGGPVLSPSQFAELSARIDAVEGGGPLVSPTALQVSLDAADFFPDPLVIPANATLVSVATIMEPISAIIEDADDGAGFILHLAGGASNVTFTNAYLEGTFEDEVWATAVRINGAWRVFATTTGALANLSDVSLWGGQQDGSVLRWSEATQSWEAGPAGAGALANLSDVSLWGVQQNGDALLWNEETQVWEAGPAGAGGGGGLPVYFETSAPRGPGLYDGVDPENSPHSLLVTGNEEGWGQPLTPSTSYGHQKIEFSYLDEDGLPVDPVDFPGMFQVRLTFDDGTFYVAEIQPGVQRSVSLAPHAIDVYRENTTTYDATNVRISHDGIWFRSYTEATQAETEDTYLHSGAPLLQRSPDGTIWEGTIDNSGVLTWAPQA